MVNDISPSFKKVLFSLFLLKISELLYLKGKKKERDGNAREGESLFSMLSNGNHETLRRGKNKVLNTFFIFTNQNETKFPQSHNSIVVQSMSFRKIFSFC